MKNKKYMLALILIVAILSISAVSAADDIISAADDNDLIVEDIQEDVDDNELILDENEDIPSSDEQSKPKLEESSDDVLTDSRTVDTPSFLAIQNVVSSSREGDTIYLKNQTYYGSGSEIVVGKSLTFIGNNTVLDAQNQSGIFNIPEGVHSVTFKNIKFTNGYSVQYSSTIEKIYSSIYSLSDNINIINCSISNNGYAFPKSDVIINNSNANVTVINSTFENNANSLEWRLLYGSSLLIYGAKTTIIDNCIFTNNTDEIGYRQGSDAGIAITCISDDIVFKNSIITDNFIKEVGFASIVSLHGKNVTVSNCSFENNTYTSQTVGRAGILEVVNQEFLFNEEYWNSTVVIDGCSFKNNQLGTEASYKGVLMVDGGSYNNQTSYNFTLRNSVFENNHGGLKYNANTKNSIIENCSFKNLTNCNDDGGAVYIYSNATTIADCIFENIPDTCVVSGRGQKFDLNNCIFNNTGTALYSSRYYSNNDTLNVKGSRFINTTGNAIYEEAVANTIIDNCSFINNTGVNGSAIYLTDYGYWNNANASITNCQFENGSASKYGGAIYISNSANTNKILIDNCRFVNNSAEDYGGAIYLVSDNAGITNSYFEKNTAGFAGSFINIADDVKNMTNISVINCSFVKNYALEGNMRLRASNSIIANCSYINNTGGAGYLGGENNSVVNCNFTNTAGINGSGSVLHISGNNSIITNCNFKNNYVIRHYASCSALDLSGNNLTAENCSFINNKVEDENLESGQHYVYIGAVGVGGKNVTVRNCIFINNSARSIKGDAVGGAMWIDGENQNIIDCKFTNNSARGVAGAGGAIVVKSRVNNTSIIGCVFEDNFATGGYSDDFGDDDVGGGAIYYEAFINNANHTIANSTFINNKVSSKYLNLTRSGTTLTVTLEGYEQYLHAIYTGGRYVENLTLNFQNVSYWDGEMLNTDDVPVVKSSLGTNQPIVFDFFDPRGNLVESITRMTDSNGRASFDYSELPGGVYTYVVYHPDNSYYSYIKGGQGSFSLSASLADLQNKIDQATDSITLDQDYIYSGTDSTFGIDINKNITIYGNGYSIDGAEQARIFNVHEGATLTLINLTLQNAYNDNGGAINNYRGAVTVINSTLKNNMADGDGGAIFNYQGNLTVINSTLEDSMATKGGAISNYQGNVTLINSTLKNNYASRGSAIATDEGESVILDNVKFVDNEGTPTYSQSGEIDTTGTKTLTAVSFVIDDISDFLNGSAITVNVAETLKGAAFNGIVTIIIGNNNYTMEVLNGAGSITVTPDLSFGDYVAKLSFAETDVYDCASTQSNMFHVMNNPALKVSVANFQTGDSFTVKVTAINTFNGAVNVVINGVTYAVNVVNGVGSKTVSANLNPGTYSAALNYAGNENFTADTASASFTVSKRTTAITAAAVAATYSVSKNLVATLKDKAGKALSGVKVTIKINGKTYTKTTDKNGQVKLAVSSLIPKTYTAAITFAGNDIYEKATKSVKVVVKKATPKMTAKAKTFKLNVKVKKYAITLKTNKNKVMKNTKVTLKVNKKTFSAKTNKKGVATFKITNLKKAGKFTAVIKYAGSKYYNKLTKKPKITVKK